MNSLISLAIVPLFLSVICYMFGSILSGKNEKSIGEQLIIGFIVSIALFQIVALPFMYYETKATGLYYICLIFITLVIFIYVGTNLKNKSWGRIYNNSASFYKKLTKEELVWWGIIIGLVVWHVFCVLHYWRLDPDDSYYITQTNTVLETGYLMNIEPTTGIEAFEQLASYKLVGHEVLLAFIAKIFRVNVAFLCHMVIPVFMIPFHYVIVYELAKRINYRYKEIFVVLSAVINLFACYSGASASAFLSYRIWQGKAVLVSMILPILLMEFWEIYKEKNVSKESIFMLIMILWAGFFTTTVGLYLIPIAYFGYTVVYFLVYKDIKNSIKLCFPVLLSLPFVFTKFITLLSQQYFSDMSGTGVTTYWQSFFSKYLRGLQDSYPNYIMAIFFFVAMIYIWKKGTKLEKMVSVYMPVVLFLTFVNPLLFSFVSTHITGEDVYWRLFWLPQFRYIVVIAMLIYISEDRARKLVSVLVMVILIAGSGDYVFKEPRYEERQNRYKLHDRVVWISDKIIEENDPENNYLLIPDDYSYEVRQYTGKIRLVWGRYVHHFYNEEDFEQLQRLYTQLYEAKIWDPDLLQKRLEYFRVNYVYIPNDALKYNELPEELEVFFEQDDYTVFKMSEN